MSQLDQLVAYLDRDGVTELVLATGRPIAIRDSSGFTNLTAKPLSPEQLNTMIRGSVLASLIPDGDHAVPVLEVDIATRKIRAWVGRRAGEVVIRLSKPGTPVPATQAIPRVGAQPQPAARAPEPAARPVAPAPTMQPRSAPVRPVAPAQTARANSGPSEFSLDALSLAEVGGLDLAPEPSSVQPPPASFAPPASSGRALDLGIGSPAGISPPSVAARGSRPAEQMYADAAPVRTHQVASRGRVNLGSFAAIVAEARQRGASDLHIAAARVTSIRTASELVPIDANAQPMSAKEAEELLAPLIPDGSREQLDRLGYVDFALEAPDGGRLRANICRQQQGLKGTFRLALPAPLPLDKLGLPADLAKVVAHHQGLVVIAGPSGHGKTTTLAALVDLVNSTKPHHILTIEDPIELVHPRKQSVISQREVGRDTKSFARGLKASLREDPDVIVIGELRDRESVEIALTAAETGHLVLATMSTPSAAKTIDRLIDMFPPEEHSQVRASVAGALRAIVAQRLLPKQGGGIVPAVELVTGCLPLAVLIRDDKLYQLPNLMQRGRAFGMIRFDESLIEHVRAGRLAEDVAMTYAESKKEFTASLQNKTQGIAKVAPR